MALPIPSYFLSGDQGVDRRTTEQDEFNRETDNTITDMLRVLFGFFGELDRFQTKDFQFSKTTNPTEDARFRHDFGFLATNYTVLNAQNNGGGSSSVDWPVRTAPIATLPVAGVDDTEFITLSFSGRGDYLIRVDFDTRIADADSFEGPS